MDSLVARDKHKSTKIIEGSILKQFKVFYYLATFTTTTKLIIS